MINSLRLRRDSDWFGDEARAAGVDHSNYPACSIQDLRSTFTAACSAASTSAFQRQGESRWIPRWPAGHHASSVQ